MLSAALHDLAQKVVTAYAAQNQKIVTAESCTGGLIAAALTSISGASSVLERGFVTYSNDAKLEILGVMPDILAQFGAVSAESAAAMAQGALEFSHADVAIATTGIAGPTGDTSGKPIGLVYLGLATRDGIALHYRCQFNGDRDDIRDQTTREALTLLLSRID